MGPPPPSQFQPYPLPPPRGIAWACALPCRACVNHAVRVRDACALMTDRLVIGLVMTERSIKKRFGASGHLFVFVMREAMRSLMSLPYIYLCTIETKGTGFLVYCANPCGLQHGLINTNERANGQPMRFVFPYTFTHARQPNGTGFFLFFFCAR